MKKYKDIFFFFFCYLLSYFFLLINNGIYWDDWLLYTLDKQTSIKVALDLGTGIIGFIGPVLLLFPHGFVLGKILTFFAYFFAGIFLNCILKSIRNIDQFSRVILVTLFMIFPVNCVRISFCVIHYAFCYFLFFFAFFLIFKYLQNKKLIFRVLALISFFVAFFTNSFLVFYLIIILYLFYREKGTMKSLKSVFFACLKYVDFILLPLIFWGLKIIFFVPNGYFKGTYNQITINSFLNIGLNLKLSFRTSFFQIIKRAVLLGKDNILLIIVLSLLIFLILKIMNFKDSKVSRKYYIFGIIFGFLCFFLALFPYLVTGNIPLNQDWLPRHQLLVPLGAVLMIFYSIQLLFSFIKINNIKIIVVSIIISLFIFANCNNYMEYYKDWFKQLALIENFKMNSKIKNGETFILIDNAYILNAKQRSFRYYEYMGLLQYVFPHSKRKYVFSFDDSRDPTKINNLFYYYYNKNLDSKKINRPDYIINIRQGNLKIDRKTFFDLFVLYNSNKFEFKNRIINYICLNVQKI
jgi:hypothetical protein